MKQWIYYCTMKRLNEGVCWQWSYISTERLSRLGTASWLADKIKLIIEWRLVGTMKVGNRQLTSAHVLQTPTHSLHSSRVWLTARLRLRSVVSLLAPFLVSATLLLWGEFVHPQRVAMGICMGYMPPLYTILRYLAMWHYGYGGLELGAASL